MSNNKRPMGNTPLLQEGEAEILLQKAIKLQHDGELQDVETGLRRIIDGPYQCSPDAALCSQALDLLCQLYQQRDAYDQIITCCRSLLEKIPNHVNAHYFLGASYQALGEDALGLQQYLQVLALAPDHAAAYLNSGILLQRQRQFKQAALHFKKAIELNPDEPRSYIELGMIAVQRFGQLQQGFEALQRAIELDPANADACFQLAKICEKTNRLEEAEQYLQQGRKLSPEHPMAYRLAATLLRRQGRVDEAIAQLEAAPIPSNDLQLAGAIHFELGKLYERKQDSARAYVHYQQGNQLQSRHPDYAGANKNVYLNMVRHIRQAFTPEWLSTWSAPFETTGKSPLTPIFLVGFPRSGTTLLDQILSSHPDLQVIEEQAMIANIQRKLASTPEGYLSVIATLEPSRIQELRQQYLDDAAHHLEPGRSGAFIDKLPLNIVHLGLIVRLFPEARIILALRHPCDACLSCFMQSFGPNNAMANFHSLEDAARLYAEVMGLWRDYTRLLPLHYHQVKYEDVVDNFEEEIRKLLSFLGLEWDPRVLEYNRHARMRGRINTPSYDQVTEKIYTRARYRWQRYEEQFRPVMPILAPFIDYFDYR